MIYFYLDWASSSMFGLFHSRSFDDVWDRILNKLMDDYGDSVTVGEHTAKFGTVDVWIANKYYAYGYDFNAPSEFRFRPSIKTMGRLSLLVSGFQDEAREKKRADYLETISKLEERS